MGDAAAPLPPCGAPLSDRWLQPNALVLPAVPAQQKESAASHEQPTYPRSFLFAVTVMRKLPSGSGTTSIGSSSIGLFLSTSIPMVRPAA
jgi:hypothetical protein